LYCSVRTKEGVPFFQAGDYVVSNDRDGSDEYAVAADRFEALYTLAAEHD
jgi:hypothetical protein